MPRHHAASSSPTPGLSVSSARGLAHKQGAIGLYIVRSIDTYLTPNPKPHPHCNGAPTRSLFSDGYSTRRCIPVHQLELSTLPSPVDPCRCSVDAQTAVRRSERRIKERPIAQFWTFLIGWA